MTVRRRKGARGAHPAIVCGLALSLVVGVNVRADAAPPGPVPVQRWVLSNGLTVLFVERRAIPAVQVHLTVKTGAAADPVGRGGLAALTAGTLTKGTATRSAVEIAEAIDFIGGTLTTAATEDFSSASLSVLKKDLHAGLALMTDVVLNPAFPAAEIDRVRRETLSAIQADKDDPGAVAEQAFAPLVFGLHPYGRPVEGAEATVSTLTREEAVAFHRTYYRPNNAVLVLVGDLSPREARRVAKAAFGAWQQQAVPAVTIPAIPLLKDRRVTLIEKDLTQATVVLGHLGIARRDPDFYAVTVMNYILGGGSFSSRLMSRIRDNEGLVYGISSGYDAKQYPGAFSVNLQTKTESAPVAIRAVLEEMVKLRAEGATEAELEAAKNYLAGSFPLRYETNSRLAPLLGMIELYGLGLTYFEDYPRNIRAVTLDDVRRVAAARLDPERYALVVVGKTDDIKSDLPSETTAGPSR